MYYAFGAIKAVNLFNRLLKNDINSCWNLQRIRKRNKAWNRDLLLTRT